MSDITPQEPPTETPTAVVTPLPEVEFKPVRTFDATGMIIFLAIMLVVGVILHRTMLKYSPNDASRWDTVYYLVQHGTYEFVPGDDVKWAQRTGMSEVWSVPVLWTIDMINIDGKYYSSKPPLLPTCMAGVALATQKISGQTFHDNPIVIVRTGLLVFQVLPFLIFLLLLRHHVFRLSESFFVRNFVVAAAAFGTFLTPWLVTFNNHVIGACFAMIAVHAAIRIWYDGRRQWYWFALAGFFAAFTAAIELPAGLLAVGLFVALLIKDRRNALLFGLVAALIPTAASLYTNYCVTGSVVPAYASFGKSQGWYDYQGSYWSPPPTKGIDAVNEPKGTYLMHMLVGHEGFFSLTPIFLLSGLGLLAHLGRGEKSRRLLAVFVLLLTAAVVAVYTIKTNNYGGGCQGFRWLFWLIPLWLLFLPTGVKLLAGNPAGRAFCYVLLAVSVISAGYALDNPWTPPWSRVVLTHMHLLGY